MKNGWTLGRIAGIDVTVHWSFGLLVAYVAYLSLSSGAGIGGALFEIGFILAAFGCVVLHELGHALTARGFGIRTHGITLLPIGGVANLEAIPRNPFQELAITAAGPMVNVVIAGVLVPCALAIAGVESVTSVNVFGGQFVSRLLSFNVIMILFNLLPAFPMDGGRMLRAILAFRLPYLQATQRAVTIGRMMAVLFFVGGLFVNPFLMVIAAFVYFAGGAELDRLRYETTVTRWPASWRNSGAFFRPAENSTSENRHPGRPTIYVVHGPRGERTEWVIR